MADELTPFELEDQKAMQLPDREAMSLLGGNALLGGSLFSGNPEIGSTTQPGEGLVPSDELDSIRSGHLDV